MLRQPSSIRGIGTKKLVVIGSLAVAILLGAVAAVAYINGPTNVSKSNFEALKVGASDPVLGSNSAPVTIFEFGDFQCPNCAQWFKTQESQLISNLVDTGKAKIVWKDFDYYGPDSTYASRAAHSAGEQGKFWDFYGLLWSSQGPINSGWANKDHLRGFAQQLGLDMTQFNQSFNSSKYDSLIVSSIDLGKELGVSGTPTFFIVGPNGHVVEVDGGQPYSTFERAVNSLIGG